MKKLLFIPMLFIMPLMAGAQTFGTNFQLGFTASPNIGWLGIRDSRTPNYTSDGARPGFSYGILADFGFARNYYFATAFTVTTINGKSEIVASNTGAGSNHANYIYKLQYIEVPLTLKLKSDPGEYGRFYGQFGLGTGVNIGARRDGKSWDNTNTLTEERNRNIKSDVNTFRLSLIVGAGAEWNINGNLNVVTGVTYNNGFTNTLTGWPEARSSYLALTFGVFF